MKVEWLWHFTDACVLLFISLKQKKKCGVCTFWLVKWGMQENQCSKYNAFENIYKCKQEMIDRWFKKMCHPLQIARWETNAIKIMN